MTTDGSMIPTFEQLVERVGDRCFYATEGDFTLDTVRDAVAHALRELDYPATRVDTDLTRVAGIIADHNCCGCDVWDAAARALADAGLLR